MKKINIIYKAFNYSFKANPKLFILGVCFGILHGLFYVLFTNSMQLFFDSLNKGTVKEVLYTFLLLGSVTLVRELSNGLHNFIGKSIREYAKRYNHRLVLSAIQSFKPIDFENVDVLNSINKANEGADSCFNFVDIFLDFFDFYLPYFVFLGFYMWKIYPGLLYILIIVFIPVIINTIIKSNLFAKHEDQVAILRRRHEGILKFFLNLDEYRESKIMDIFSYLNQKRKSTLETYHQQCIKVNFRAAKIDILMRVITLLGYFGVICFLGYLLKYDIISVGCFAALFASIDIFFDMMKLAIYNNLGGAFQNLVSVKNFIEFIENKKDNKDNYMMSIDKIELKEVGFSYIEDINILKRINLCIKKGEVLAIVGENGMGKSTLAKLLCGIYIPRTGSILINGKEVREQKILVQNSTALFQKFGHYKLSLEENISFSKHESKAYVLSALNKAGIYFSEKELDDEVGREFNGSEFSGGQWQRIALARCIYKDADIMVLDEPTSAIDPLEESALYFKFKEIMENKIGIIVTHRIGAARLADIIIVMENGMIVEQGSHEELMKRKGKYYNLFCSQAVNYIGE